jgi:hypothetical protein
MPITSFIIGGDEVNPLFESLEIRESVGGLSTLSCDIVSEGSPVLRFDLHAEVSAQEDGVTIFAGTLTRVREAGYGGPNIYDQSGAPQIVTTITAEDYSRLAERVYVTEDVAEGTSLETFLTTLVDDYLDQFGVTLDAAQVTGPALPAMTFDLKRASEVLQALSDATGFIARIDYDKKLRMWQEGELSAPFDIDEFDDPPKWTDDVSVENILGSDYANRIRVISDPINQVGRTETFTGDGSEDTFELEATLTQPRGFVSVDGVLETLTIEGIGFDLAAHWLYRASDNTIRRAEQGVPDPPANGAVISITFDGTFQATASAEDAGEIAANGLYEHVERRNDITTNESAQEMADSLLAERLLAGEQLTVYRSRFVAPTLRAGQQQAITATARGLSGDYIIRELSVSAETPVTDDYVDAGLGLIRTVTVKKQRPLVGKWEHTYRDWLKAGTGASSSVNVGTGGPTSIGAAPPLKSVQTNQGGQLAGDAEFTYDPVTNSLALGSLSSITATHPESCAAIGYDCHIEDPA